MSGHLRRGSGATGCLGLHTDLYEIRMVESYLASGMTQDATFSLYVRPTLERPWFVALGVTRFLEMLEVFRFGSEELAYLRALGVSQEALGWFETFVPSGEVWAVPDGTILLANEPILEYTAPMPVAQILETVAINLVQFPTLIATKAARVALAAHGRSLADFGFRRAQGLESGIEAAWAAHVGGGMVTSNVEAGRRYGIDVTGTMAHSFVQSFDDEIEAFRTFASHHPRNTILLVDTYDTLDGVRKAITVAEEMRERGHELRGIRLDSGDLRVLSVESRRLLDDAGFPDVQIFASGGLDEEEIHALVEARAPIDAFGVGTDLVVSRDRPAVDIAYKLVDYGGEPRAKLSAKKATLPGAKQIFRSDGPSSDVLGRRKESLPGRGLLELVWKDGHRRLPFDMAESRELVRRELEALPETWKRPPYPTPPPQPRISDGLQRLDHDVRTVHDSD